MSGDRAGGDRAGGGVPAPPLTLLYAPGDRPEVVAKALRAGADVVLVDLEDAVAPARKEYARDATAELLAEKPPVPVHVRVNCPSSPEGRADLKTLLPCPGLGGVRLPKVTSPDTVAQVAGQASALGRTGLPLFPLLESALGVEEAFRIARADPSVGGVSLGEADLRADLGVREDAGLDWCRSRVVVAARAAGLRPPAQSVHPDVRDLEGLRAGCARGRALGFLGRAAIHPRQLPVIARAYLPTAREVEEAQEIVEAARRAGPGAQALPDGRFVDAAVLATAHRTLALAARH